MAATCTWGAPDFNRKVAGLEHFEPERVATLDATRREEPRDHLAHTTRSERPAFVKRVMHAS